MSLDWAPAGWMDVQLAEFAAEVSMLVDAELLVTKENHQVVHQCVVDLLELLVTQRFGQVDTMDLGADHWRHFSYLNGLVAHGIVPTVRSIPASGCCGQYCAEGMALATSGFLIYRNRRNEI